MPYSYLFNQVFSVESGIAAGIAAIVIALLVFACWRYRARQGSGEPSHRSEWTLLEGSYTVAVLCCAAFLVWLSYTNMFKEQNADTQKPALTVLVTGFQWCWRFTYVGHHSGVMGSCHDGTHLPTLVLPRGDAVKFEITSNDVIHEFWLPQLDMKWEAFPNHINDFTATFDKDGRWLGHCAEFCGLDHADMLFWVEVEPKSVFHHWLVSHPGLHVE